ncbi:MAG TPA: TIGR03086 family metal-binding protein [Propionibacteriaceae bacterium]|nr:TIGR03086 family metal-binding protein [Propionibacteriaceae bacterium]
MSDQTRTAFSAAGASVSKAIRAGAGTDLDARTPCRDFDLRRLAQHFVGTSGAFVRAGETGALDPEDPWGGNAQLDDAAWAEQLAGQVDRLAAAWSRPEAWDKPIDGAQMPTEAIGEMGLLELMLHGWDVARATGQSLEVPAELGAEVLRCLLPTLEQGRAFDVYGPEVSVPEDASDFDRALGLSGRDPQWSA